MNDNNQPVVKASMRHQHRDAAQWWNHRIKRDKETFSKSTINRRQQQQQTSDNSSGITCTDAGSTAAALR